MKDGLICRMAKRVALGCFYINLYMTRVIWRLRGERPYTLGGECAKCAACCEAPSIQVGWIVWHFPTIRRLFLWWHLRVNGFELVDRVATQRVFVFRCAHFDWETRRCNSYGSRPGMCRDYPRALLWQANPEMLPPCGYRPIDPKGGQLTDALKKEGLGEEELEKVRKKLHLE